jgi:hypothetical protein
MKTITAFIKRHPVLTFYILAFAISWGGILILVGPGGFPSTAEQVDYFVGVNNPSRTMSILIFAAFGLLLLTVFAGFAYDLQRRTDVQQTPAMST